MSSAILVSSFASSMVNSSGVPLSGYLVVAYEAGTSTEAAVWYNRQKTDPSSAGTTRFNLDADGTKAIYATSLNDYKVFLPGADPTVDSPVKTIAAIDVFPPLSIAGYTALKAFKGSFSDGLGVFVTYRDTLGDGGDGKFYWDSSDLSASVTTDTVGGIYVPPDTDTTGASGAWVRQHSGPLSIKWFGGDTAAAVAAAFALGDVVYWPQDTYTHSTLRTVPANKRVIGYSATINGPGFFANSGVTVEGFIFDGTNDLTGPNQGVWAENASDVTVRNNKFKRTILYTKSDTGTVPKNLRVLDNEFSGNFTGLTLGNSDSIRINGVDGIIIRGNIFDIQNAFRFIKITGDLSASIGENIADTTKICRDVLVTENVFRGNTSQTGIDLFVGTDGFNICNNAFDMTTTSAIAIKPGEIAAAPVSGAYSGVIANNVFAGTYTADIVSMQGPYGMAWYSGPSIMSICDNMFIDASNVAAGKAVVRGWDHANISGNFSENETFTAATVTNISVAACRHATVKNNTFWGRIALAEAATTSGGVAYSTEPETILIDGNMSRGIKGAGNSIIDIGVFTSATNRVSISITNNKFKTDQDFAAGMRAVLYLRATSTIGTFKVIGNETDVPDLTTDGFGVSTGTADVWIVEDNSWQYGSALPTEPFWPKGACFFYRGAGLTAGGYIGAVNITDGNPPTFKNFGAVVA